MKYGAALSAPEFLSIKPQPLPMKPKNTLPPWLRPKASASTVLVYVGWYTQVDWAKVKAAAIDNERFEDTYDEWVEMADQALADLRATGLAADRLYVSASELLAWCLAHNKPNDAASRAEFVSEQGRKSHGTGT